MEHTQIDEIFTRLLEANRELKVVTHQMECVIQENSNFEISLVQNSTSEFFVNRVSQHNQVGIPLNTVVAIIYCGKKLTPEVFNILTT